MKYACLYYYFNYKNLVHNAFVACYNDQCSRLILAVDITTSLFQYQFVTVLFKQQNNPIAITGKEKHCTYRREAIMSIRISGVAIDIDQSVETH